MNVTEASATNVLLRSIGVAYRGMPAQAITADEVVAAVETLARCAHNKLMAGVGVEDVERWRDARIVPTIQLFEAIHDFVALDPECWFEQAGAFTCTEADAIGGLLRAMGEEHTADVFIAAHTEKDDEGDAHRVQS